MRTNRWLAVLAALLLVVVPVTAAHAGGVLPNGGLVAASTAQSFSYTTNVDYWSVVAVQPTATSDYDLFLYDAGGSQLSSSGYPTGQTDFVAVDSNTGTRPYGTYYPHVSQYMPGSYWIQAQYGASIITLPQVTHHGTSGAGDPDIAFISLSSNNIVSIADVYLTAGQSFWAVSPTASTELYLLEANPSQSSTFVQGRPTAASQQHTQAIDNCTLYTAQLSGWHSLVLIANTPPTTTNPQQGIAVGLHRYDPTQPNYCPLANFPAPTP